VILSIELLTFLLLPALLSFACMGFQNQAFSEQGFRYNTGGAQFAAFFIIGIGNTGYGAGVKQTISPELADLHEASISLSQKLVYPVGMRPIAKFNLTVNFSFCFLFGTDGSASTPGRMRLGSRGLGMLSHRPLLRLGHLMYKSLALLLVTIYWMSGGSKAADQL